MITGFNTDIEHEGVVYHVQTEDKGLDSPLILSLVYSGGAILASKRSPYKDLIASGFNEEALAQRLKRQHRLICAAINAGRIEDLKRMGTPVEDKAESTVSEPEELQPVEIVDNASDYALFAETPAQAAEPEPLDAPEELKSEELEPEELEPEELEPEELEPEELEIVRNLSDYASFIETQPIREPAPADVEPEPLEQRATVEPSPYTVHDARRESPLGAPLQFEGLNITILDEQEFWAGGNFHIRIMVAERSGPEEKPVVGASLSVKILGTAFRPQLYSVKTERDGVAVVSAQIPRFTSGRAAILIRAEAVDGRSTETRRVILAAK